MARGTLGVEGAIFMRCGLTGLPHRQNGSRGVRTPFRGREILPISRKRIVSV